MITALRNAINTTLSGISGIKAVYNYPKLQTDAYPYAWVVWLEQNSSVLTNKEDSVVYLFEINLIQEKIEEFGGREEAEDGAMDLAYDICEAFRSNNNLGLSGVIRTLPIKVSKNYVDNNTRIALKILLEVQTIEEVS